MFAKIFVSLLQILKHSNQNVKQYLFLEPKRVWAACSNVFLEFYILNHCFLFSINKQHSSWFQTALKQRRWINLRNPSPSQPQTTVNKKLTKMWGKNTHTCTHDNCLPMTGITFLKNTSVASTHGTWKNLGIITALSPINVDHSVQRHQILPPDPKTNL